VNSPKTMIPNPATSRGFSLLEVMIASSILLFAIGGVTSFIGQMNKSKKYDRLKDVQELLGSRIKTTLSSPSHLLYSLSRHETNPTIARCLLGIKDKNPHPCEGLNDPKNPKIFGLYQVTGSKGTQGVLITTPEKGMPIFYDIDGNLCKKQKDLCTFQAKSWFWIQCGKDDSKCSLGPTQVFFTYQITGQGFAPYPKKKKPLPPLSLLQILGPNRFSQCSEPNSKEHHGFLVGHDDRGFPLCRCLYPFVKESEETDPVTKRLIPRCRLLGESELACNSQDKSFLRGFRSKEDKKEALCMDRDTAFDCAPMPMGESCPKNSWITRMASTSCSYVCEFAMDGKDHKCELNWNLIDRAAEPQSLEDSGVFPDFICPISEVYCCQPSQYEEKK
jgi:prepilin-type N-terminal cleavage/methylation domain-containing protein